MTLPTHIVSGVLIGSVTGDFTHAVIGATILDIDHLGMYFRILAQQGPIALWKTATLNYEGEHKFQRSYLHSIPILIIPSILFFIVGLHKDTAALSFLLGVWTHLILDIFDDSESYVFYPFDKETSFRGILKFCSTQEIILNLGLVLVAGFIAFYF